MPRTLPELLKTVESLDTLVRPHCQRDPRFKAIAEVLKHISTTIQDGQPSLHIISPNTTRTCDIQERLMADQELASLCRLAASTHPQARFLDPSTFAPRLRLQISDHAPEYVYLETVQEACQGYRIGRAADCDVIIPDQYLFVSGHHSILEYAQETSNWSIEDTSKNGTFVNGQRLDPSVRHSLKTGDRLLLGNDQPADNDLELIFDAPFGEASSNNFTTPFRDFDIACFLVDFDDNLTMSEQQTLEYCKKLAGKSNTYVLIDVKNDIKDERSPDLKSIEKAIKAFKARLVADAGLNTSNLHHVYSDFLSSQAEARGETQKLNRDFWRIVDKLKKKLRERGEACLISRLMPQLEACQKIIKLLTQNENCIESGGSSRQTQDDQREKIAQLAAETKAAVQAISFQEKIFFDQIEDYLISAEKQLFDDLYADSFPCKLQLFSEQLKPAIHKFEHRKILQLRHDSPLNVNSKATSLDEQPSPDCSSPQTINANDAMLAFCKLELYQWSQNLWLKVRSNPINGGIAHLHKEILLALESVSWLDVSQIKKKLNCQDLEIDIDAIFNNDFAQVPDEVLIKEPSAFPYLVRKFRSQGMQFIYLFSFFSILGIAGRRQIMRNLMAPIINLFGRAPLFSGLALIGLCFFVIRCGVNIYREELNEGRNKKANELRVRLFKHYQELAKKHLTKPFLAEIKLRLIEEKKRIEAIRLFVENHREFGEM